jgi:ribosome-binding factor A
MGIRQEKVARQIQKDLAELMQQHRSEWMAGAFVTISNVTITPDLGYVNIYLSLYNNANRTAVLDHINGQNKEIRKALAKRVRHSFRTIPELRFYEDNTMDYVEKMDDLFKKIHSEDQKSNETPSDTV